MVTLFKASASGVDMRTLNFERLEVLSKEGHNDFNRRLGYILYHTCMRNPQEGH